MWAASPNRDQASFEGYRSVRYFGSLDGLRCVSIVAVIWQHAAGYVYEGMPWLTLLTRGFMGVELFFVISGFLITTLLLREQAEYGEVSLKKFYLRRTLRIFPLYYSVLALYTVLVLLMDRHNAAGRGFFHNMPYFLTYTTNWFVDLKINEDGVRRVIFIFAWSLATEEQFYLIWPSIFRFLKRFPPLAVVGLAIIINQAAKYGLLSWAIPTNSRGQVILVSISTGICLGVVAAHVLHSRAGFERAARLLGRRWSAPVALVLMLGVQALPIGDVPTFRLLSQITMTLLVVACVIREDNALAPVLGSAPFRRIGMVSYGMYMLHMLAMHVSDKVLHTAHLYSHWWRFVGGLAGAYAAAALSYRYYEGFFLRLKDRLGGHGAQPKRQQTVVAASEAAIGGPAVDHEEA
jgi:peptidoglycan/LPS O-acetylase OafA/YrhL